MLKQYVRLRQHTVARRPCAKPLPRSNVHTRLLVVHECCSLFSVSTPTYSPFRRLLPSRSPRHRFHSHGFPPRGDPVYWAPPSLLF